MTFDELKSAARRFRAGSPLEGEMAPDHYTNMTDQELAALVREAVRIDTEDMISGEPSRNMVFTLRGRMAAEHIEFKIERGVPHYDGHNEYKVLLKRPAPKRQEGDLMDHHPDCNTCTAEGIYDDETCDLCKQIVKVIKLRRVTVANGSQPNEVAIAERQAEKLIKQYGLMEGDIVDSKYTPTAAAPQAVYTPNPAGYDRSGFGPRYQQPPPRPRPQPRWTPPPPNTGNFGAAPPPSGSRMRANNPKGKNVRFKKGDSIKIG